MDRINWQRVRDILISIIGVGLLLWASFSIIGIFIHVIVLLLLAMAVAYLVTPLVNSLHKHMPRLLAALIVYFLVMAGLIALCYALVFSLIQQVTYFSAHLPEYAQNLPSTYSTIRDWLIKQGIPQSSIDKAILTIEDQANAFAVSIATNLVSIVLIVTNAIVNVLLVVVLSFYLTLDGKRIRNALINIAPKRSMPHVLQFENALNNVVGKYIRGQLTLAAIIGVLAGVGCYFLGLSNFALIIGALAFLFETIPMVGPALASIPAILISLLLPDPFPRTYIILLYFIFIQLIETYVLGPRIVGHAVGLHPVVSILALIIGAQLLGAFGALLATPLVAALWVVTASFYRTFRGESADEILAKKPSSRIRRSPRDSRLKLRIGTFINANPARRKTGTDSSEDASPSPAGVKQQQENSSLTPGKIERVDLLRAGPEQEQTASVSSERSAESDDEK